ncbi:PIN domain-containing protein [Actinoplanes sp. NPDC049265]|uniref:PIN domain-containing protein n=1 Tax=Actinoplanes sp. NPDC049265 TaxID=3363902 RepID=UPI0037182621
MSIETLVLDSQGFSSWIDRDRKVLLLLEQAERDGADLAMSAATIIEVPHRGVDIARLNWLLSRIRIEPVTKEAARRSAGLLREAKLHGHKYAIDAMVAEVALRLPGPAVILTSDVDDIVKLCGDRVRLVAV